MEVRQNWENDGHLVLGESKTLDRYKELCKLRSSTDCYKHHCFFAFSNEQFEEGKKKAGITDEKIYSAGMGLYGTKEGIGNFYDEIGSYRKKIKAECDPQEVYYYEYNNYECCIDWDGDTRAIEQIIHLFGADVARQVKRLRAFQSIDEILGKA